MDRHDRWTDRKDGQTGQMDTQVSWTDWTDRQAYGMMTDGTYDI